MHQPIYRIRVSGEVGRKTTFQYEEKKSSNYSFSCLTKAYAKWKYLKAFIYK